jgi:hypothetical protein
MERKLIQMPGGDWLDPHLVTQITAVGKQILRSNGQRIVTSPHVEITLQSGEILVEGVRDQAAAERLRDRIAADVNQSINPLLSGE